MRCPGPNRRNKYLAPDVNEVPITFVSDLMAQIELSCQISHLSLMYSDGVVHRKKGSTVLLDVSLLASSVRRASRELVC